MAKEIAVFIGADGRTATLYEPGKIVVFTKWSQKWQLAREQALSLAGDRDLRGMRQKMSEILAFLGDCKIFVGQSVTGLPYFELEKGQVSVWEFEGLPLDFLDYVWAKEDEAKINLVNQAEVAGVSAPIDLGNGCFRVSIQDIQNNNSGITSKQILLPLLSQGKFYQLEVLCSHLPPWLEMELGNNRFVGTVEKLAANQIKVLITHQPCNS
jgi:Fe-only nitrogenase accessory protein AnfO